MADNSTQNTANNLPPPRQKPGQASVKPPLSNISLSSFIYIVAALVLLFSGFYTFRLAQWKNDAGGWVNLALGKSPNQPIINTGSSPTPAVTALNLEARMRELADELGIHPRELASAIKPLLPPSTSSSLASVQPAGTAASVLAEDDPANPAAGSVFENMAGLGGIVGLDEPFEET